MPGVVRGSTGRWCYFLLILSKTQHTVSPYSYLSPTLSALIYCKLLPSPPRLLEWPLQGPCCLSLAHFIFPQHRDRTERPEHAYLTRVSSHKHLTSILTLEKIGTVLINLRVVTPGCRHPGPSSCCWQLVVSALAITPCWPSLLFGSSVFSACSVLISLLPNIHTALLLASFRSSGL